MIESITSRPLTPTDTKVPLAYLFVRGVELMRKCALNSRIDLK